MNTLKLNRRPAALSSLIRTLAGVFLLLAIGSSPAQAGQKEQKQQKGGTTAAAEQKPYLRLSAGKIAAQPSQYLGQRVAVHAEIDDVMTQNMFTLDEDRAFAGPDVLVLVPEATARAERGGEVSVLGVVRPFVRAEIERDYKWFRFDQLTPEVKVELERRPVIVAESVRTEAGMELVRGASAERLITASAGTIAKSPTQF